ncbi:MAG: hypothetical protein APR63_08065 [Desulfuromonas sp. SDB]|nr:MAG: hypothetical protein APR63_08065 [Desulfuromonas sp. SDB]
MKLKKRKPGKSFPVITSELEQGLALFSEPSPPLKLLCSQFWPGPLTVISKARSGIPCHLTDKNKFLAVRVPLPPTPLHLVKAFQYLVATSANLSDLPTGSNIYKVAESFKPHSPPYWGSMVNLLPRQSSTVAGYRKNKIEVYRKGALDITRIINLTGSIRYVCEQPLNVLIVCKGNTCRSPLAEVIANQIISPRFNYRVKFNSAGLETDHTCTQLSPAVKKILKNKYKWEKTKIPQKLTSLHTTNADFILAMEDRQIEALKQIGGDHKVFKLTGFSSSHPDIPDPWEKGESQYILVEQMIADALNDFSAYLKKSVFDLQQ